MEGVVVLDFIKLGDECSYNERFKKIHYYQLAARLGNDKAKEFCIQQLGDKWEQEVVIKPRTEGIWATEVLAGDFEND